MKFFCEASTAGGPVAIMTLAAARHWKGGRDYFAVIRRQPVGRLQLFTLGRQCSGCLFREVDDGEFLVYCSKDAFLVLSEGHAPDEEHSIKKVLPNIDNTIVPTTPLELPKFGGRVAIFDFALPGSLITLKKPGFQSLHFPGDLEIDKERPEIPSAVVVEVERGSWQVQEVHRQDASYSFSGVLFRRISV